MTGGLDAIYFASTTPATSSAVTQAFKTLSIDLSPSILPLLSYYATILTLLSAFPAVSTGALELIPVLLRDGFSSKKAQMGTLHALVNDVTVAAAAYNWWTRRNEAAFLPSGVNVAVSACVAVPASLFAAYLGGKLVYEMGMGVGRGTANKGKKAQ